METTHFKGRIANAFSVFTDEVLIHLWRIFLKNSNSLDLQTETYHATEAWVARTAADSPDRQSRQKVLDEMFERMYQLGNRSKKYQPLSMAFLASRLRENYIRTGDMKKLDDAITIQERVLATAHKDDKLFSVYQLFLQDMLHKRLLKNGSLIDLNRVIEVNTEVLEVATPNSSKVGTSFDLVEDLGARFRQTKSVADLDRAIKVGSKALTNAPFGHPDRDSLSRSLAERFFERFQCNESIGDLDKAIEFGSATGPSTSDENVQCGALANVGSRLYIRFKITGSIEDLNASVDRCTEALALASGHPQRFDILHSLARKLTVRNNHTLMTEDIERSITLTTEALSIMPSEDTQQADLFDTRKWSFHIRWLGSRSMEDYDSAVEASRKALEMTPMDHSERGPRLHYFQRLLQFRSGLTGSTEDSSRAAQAASELSTVKHLEKLKLRAVDLPHLPLSVYRLNSDVERMKNVSRLLRKCEQTASLVDIDSAITAADDALKASFSLQDIRMLVQCSLAQALIYKLCFSDPSQETASYLPALKNGWDCEGNSPSNTILYAEMAALAFVSHSDWEWASRLIERAVQLLPLANPRSLKLVDKQGVLKNLSGIGPKAAMIALKARKQPYDALKVLESARSIIAGSLMELRGDLSDLEQRHPNLAAQFTSLRNDLDKPTQEHPEWEYTPAVSWESDAGRAREADKDMTKLIAEIRALPEFSNFLLPPSEDELKATASHGPIIVVNVDSIACKAFLVECHQIRALDLPNLTEEDVTERVRKLRMSYKAASSFITSTLEWLWDAIAKPCLDALGYQNAVTDDRWPQVWWIPTGPLVHLPLHAAGYHMKKSDDTVLDRVISSYSLSIKGLRHGRGHNVQANEHYIPRKCLLVAMQETPGDPSDLPFAAEETHQLEDLCKSLKLDPIRLGQQTRKEVLDHMKESTVFHFAGHGLTNPLDPSQSSLLLEDWETNPLTLGHLRDLRLQDRAPFLAYLSACSTSANEAEKLDDEGLNLVGACQLAGFRHVIGTLWEVSDKHCVDVAKTVYGTLRDEGMTDRAVALGLHRALRALRDDSVRVGRERARAEAAMAGSKTDREGRDGTLVGAKHQGKKRAEELVNPFWVPYVHFGA